LRTDAQKRFTGGGDLLHLRGAKDLIAWGRPKGGEKREMRKRASP